VSAIQQNLTKLEKVTKSLPKGSQRSPISAKIAQKDAPTYHLKTRETKTPKRHSNKTCLSKGTGSAFKGGEFAQHSLNSNVNLNERERESKDLWGISKEYLRHTCGIPNEYIRSI